MIVAISLFILCCLVAAWRWARRGRMVVYLWGGNQNRVPPKDAVVINTAGEENRLDYEHEFFVTPSPDLLAICRLMFPGALFLFED